MGFSHTSHTTTHVLQHRCDQWASADAGIVRQDSPRASRPQAILKLRPPSSLDYKARHGPQTPRNLILYHISNLKIDNVNILFYKFLR